ncbi:MAG: hypothetical protein U0235_28100 [Polyangiaceae bacterium]
MEHLDDATLRKKTLLSVLAMGGGCALLLSVLGAGSMWIARAGEPSASTASSETRQVAVETDPRSAAPAHAPALPKTSDRHSKAPSSI